MNCVMLTTSETTETPRQARGDKRWIAAAILILCTVVVARADQVDDLIKQLGSTNDEDRAEAADALSHVGGARAVKEFREMLTSSSAASISSRM